MSEQSEPEFPRRDPKELRRELAELVRRTLLELGEMSRIQDRIREISDRISSVTPRPEQPAEPDRKD